jgi:hypothetical protein
MKKSIILFSIASIVSMNITAGLGDIVNSVAQVPVKAIEATATVAKEVVEVPGKVITSLEGKESVQEPMEQPVTLDEKVGAVKPSQDEIPELSEELITLEEDNVLPADDDIYTEEVMTGNKEVPSEDIFTEEISVEDMSPVPNGASENTIPGPMSKKIVPQDSLVQE